MREQIIFWYYLHEIQVLKGQRASYTYKSNLQTLLNINENM